MDDDGVRIGERVPIRVRVEVSGDQMKVDLTNVAKQVAGFYNSGETAGRSCCQVAFKCLTSPLDLPISRHVVAAIERAHRGERAVLMPSLGGSVPIWAFTDILKLPTLLVPYANANNRQHSPNEHLRLDHLFQGARTTAELLTDPAIAGSAW